MTEKNGGSAAAPRQWKLWAASGVTAIVLIAIGCYAGYSRFRFAVPKPPKIDLTGAEPAVINTIRSASAAVDRDPRSAESWGRLAMALHVHNLLPAAQVCFETAERLEPSAPKWPYLAAINLLEDSPDPVTAEACLRRAVARSDGAEPAGAAHLPRLRLAELLVEQGRLDEADSQLQVVLRGDAHDPRALLDAGRIALARGDLTTSLACLTDSADRLPAVRATQALLAEVQHRLGNETAAARARSRAAALPVHYRWSDPYLGDMEKYWRGVLAEIHRADNLFDDGHKTEAVKLLNKTVAEHPDSLAAALTLARFYRESGDIPRAIEVASAAVDGNSEAMEAHLALGKALAAQGQVSSAAKSFQRAIALKPDFVAAWHLLARAKLAAGEHAAAEEAFRKCLRLGPGLASAHRELGELLLADGRRDEAAQCLALAVELDPNDERARKLLADLH